MNTPTPIPITYSSITSAAGWTPKTGTIHNDECGSLRIDLANLDGPLADLFYITLQPQDEDDAFSFHATLDGLKRLATCFSTAHQELHEREEALHFNDEPKV